MPRPQQVGSDVLAAPEQVPCGLLLLGRDVHRRRRPCPIQGRHMAGVSAVRLDAIPGRRRINTGAIRSHLSPSGCSARCNSKAHGPASLRYRTLPCRRSSRMNCRNSANADVIGCSSGVR